MSSTQVERCHWLNAIVGAIDAAWNLSPEEEHLVIRIVSHILDELNVPDRDLTANLPAPVAMELEGGFYSAQMGVPDPALLPTARPLQPGDQTFSPDVWRDALVLWFTSSYRLTAVERLWLSNTVGDMLGGIGAATRAPAFLPADVVRVASNR